MRTFTRPRIQDLKEIQKVLVITLCWVGVQSVLYVQEYYSTMDLIHLEKLTGTYEFWPDFIGSLLLSVFGGAIGGTILVLKKPVLALQKSYVYDVIESGLLFIIYYQ